MNGTFTSSNTILNISDTSAQMVSAQSNQLLWWVAPGMFAPSVAGTPPVITVTATTRKRVIQPPTPPPGNGGGKGGPLPQSDEGQAATSGEPEDDGSSVITTIVITVAGASFPATQIVADCVMTLTYYSGTDINGDPLDGGVFAYQQTFGGISLPGYNNLDAFTGYVSQPFTQTALQVASTPSWNLALDAGAAVTLLAAPGYVGFSSSSPIGTATVQSGSVNMNGTFSSLTLQTINPNSDSDLDFDAARVHITIASPEGWTLPLPGSDVAIGTLSTVDGPSYDTAIVEIAANTDGSLPFDVSFERTLSGSSVNHQYDLTLLPGLSVLGDASAAAIIVPLINASLYIVVDAGPVQFSLSGQMGLGGGQWTTGAFALTLNNSGTGKSGYFYFSFSAGQGSLGTCQVPVATIACSLPDALTLPIVSPQTLILLPSANMPAGLPPNYVALGTLAGGATRAYFEGISFQMVRPADLAVVTFSFAHCGVLQPEGSALQFARATGGPDPQVTAIIPPQHITEMPFNLQSGGVGSPPFEARMANPSTLVYKLDPQPAAGTGPLPFTAETLLDWKTTELIVPTSVGQLSNVTTLELPYRIFLAPQGLVGWVSPAAPDPANSTAELWHARMGYQQENAAGNGTVVSERPGIFLAGRAMGSPDYPAPGPGPFIPEALTPQDRHDIVDETNADTVISIDRLILSAVGATADLTLEWAYGNLPAGDDLTAWTQNIGQGRDQYVRAVLTGFLLPWGHAASYVSVSQRRFSGDANNTSYLDEKFYIAVTQTTRAYTEEITGVTIPRDAPFPTLEILTKITPDLNDPSTSPVPAGSSPAEAFWIMANGQPYLFHARIHDGDTLVPNKTASVMLPAIFVPAGRDDLISAAMTAYNTSGPVGGAPVKTTKLDGQKLAVAISKTPGDTTHSIQSVDFEMRDLRTGPSTPWNLNFASGSFCPAITQAVIDLPVVRMLTSAANTEGIAATYLPQYLQSADPLGTNPIDGYMQFPSVAAGLAEDKANGLISPALAITGLSRTMGAVAGNISSLANGTLDLNALLGNAMLLNLFPFTTLITDAGFDLGQIPLLQQITTPETIVATYRWQPTITQSGDGPPSWSDPAGFARLTFNGGLDQSVSINSTVTTTVSASTSGGTAAPPSTTTLVVVNDFSLEILGLVQINFASFTFTAITGKKPDVKITLADNAFVLVGQIDFLQVLLEAIEDLFDEGPAINIDDEEITLSFVFAVPDIGMGYFDLSNIAVGVDIALSLSTNPIQFHFHFAGPDNPFDLAADLLGGGGYFIIDTADAATTSITFSAQAGASVSLDLGVASGSVSLMFGVTFQTSSTDNAGNGPMITGYFRADGELTVLQILSIHVSFYLGVTYQPANLSAGSYGILWGEASMTVEVSLLFFHKSVTLTVRKEIPVKIPKIPLISSVAAGPLDSVAAPALPAPIDQIMSAADWELYAQAFVAA